MSIQVRDLTRSEVVLLVDQYNLLRRDLVLATLSDGYTYHADATALITDDDAVTDGYGISASALLNACVTSYSAHLASAIDADGLGAHKVEDSVNVITAPEATDVATGITLSDQVKVQYNLHIADTTYHFHADSTNTVTLSNDTTEAGLVALVNEIKAKLNAHYVGAFGSQSIQVIPA